jgi:poly-gamma-glutamate synthesis protein (capsule biosynthesis protein)
MTAPRHRLQGRPTLLAFLLGCGIAAAATAHDADTAARPTNPGAADRTGTAPGGPAPATELQCGLRTGDRHTTLRARPTRDPLAATEAGLGGRFLLQAVALARADAPQTVDEVIVRVIDTESGDLPQVLVHSRWQHGLPTALGEGQAWAPNLSGWQRVYSPYLGRELAWGCALVRSGAEPAGWHQVDATGPALRESAPARPQPTAAGRQARLRLAWMGDVMLADGPGRVIARGGDPFAHVGELLRSADLRIANLECVIATGGQRVPKPWAFRAHPRTLPVLQRHVDVVSLANNHSGDFGAAAFDEMLGRLERAGLPWFGGGRTAREAHQPRIIERQGLRIALLAYNEMFPRQFEATERSAGAAWADEERIVAAIRAARRQADIVIPYLHWGQEQETVAHARQRALARRMIEAGADAVVGTHPHVRQDSEIIDGKPVIYSLGNFVFDGFDKAEQRTGSILWMTVDAHGVQDWSLQPVVIDADGRPRALPR